MKERKLKDTMNRSDGIGQPSQLTNNKKCIEQRINKK